MIEIFGFILDHFGAILCFVAVVLAIRAAWITRYFEYSVKDFHPVTDIPQTVGKDGKPGRWLCAPNKRRYDGYCPYPHKVYIVRQCENLPHNFVLVKKSSYAVRSHHSRPGESRRQLNVDVINHGFNALLSAEVRHRYIQGQPALIVSRNYTGNIDLLVERCQDDFTNCFYCDAKPLGK